MDPIGIIKPRSPPIPASTSDTADDAVPVQPLYLKYRPKNFSEVRGQNAAVEVLKRQLSSKSCPHAWLFTGPSGVGKTTLARIVALQLEIQDVQEIDAASSAGVGAIRSLVETCQFRSLLGSRKMIVLDECHTLSKQAWQPLLKVLEEPPDHLYFALCTTESYKVPETIKTRCQVHILASVSPHVLEDILEAVSETSSLPAPVKGVLVAYAEGSIRRLLSGAEKVYRFGGDAAASKSALGRLEAEDESPALVLARLIIAHRLTWTRAREQLAKLKDQNPESARIVIVNYLNTVLLSSEALPKAEQIAGAIGVLGSPVYEPQGMADLAIAILSLSS